MSALLSSPPAKPLAARELEARARARDKGVRVTVVVPERHYYARSHSEAGVIHSLTRTARGWTCTCKGYTFTGCCHHIGALERRSEREGWTFGRIVTVSAQAAPADLDELRRRKAAGNADLFGA